MLGVAVVVVAVVVVGPVTRAMPGVAGSTATPGVWMPASWGEQQARSLSVISCNTAAEVWRGSMPQAAGKMRE